MKVIILVGTPGSGKSTFAAKYPNYTIINQDTMGNRYACLEAFRKALKDDKNVIIDRCNINKMQRRIWLLEAQKYDVKEINAVYLHVNPEECLKRISNRIGHPTIKPEMPIEKKQQIVYSFIETFEMPEISEGFNKILVIKNE